MHVTCIDEAKTYQAPNHDNMTCFRLQGKDASPCEQTWMSMSVYEPGGQTGFDGSDGEKIYLVLEGEITVFFDLEDGSLSETILRQNASCVFLRGQKRQLKNLSDQVANVVLVMASN